MRLHPAQRIEAVIHQPFCKRRIAAVLGDASQVVEEILGGVARKVGTFDFRRGEIGHQTDEVVDAVVNRAHRPRGESRVATAQLERRALQQCYLGATFARAQRRAKRGVTSTDDHDAPRHSESVLLRWRRTRTCVS